MGLHTGIEWAHATWNPWYGCKKVSDGCKHCYMFRDMHRHNMNPDIITRAKTNTFNSPLRWAKRNILLPGARIFVCSWSDYFIDEADQFRDNAWQIIRDTPEFIYLIVTKRPERIEQCLPNDWILKNVWLLVSTENQTEYDKRWSILKNIPAAIRGVSAEPLLNNINIEQDNVMPDWIITGGESGTRPRPMKPEWLINMIGQAKMYGIPLFHKQNGGTKKIHGTWGGDMASNGKKYKQYPAIVQT